jgi:aminoglycoside phosphotransferase (APT) family kinase protein
MSEIALGGGRVTPSVVRVGDTVRRPAKANTPFVRILLAELAEHRFDAAPRYLGRDEQGREMFAYVEGDVPDDLDPDFSDETLIAAARLIRRYHDATARSTSAKGAEVVCHNDLSPCNFVFREGTPIAIIDFDSAAPGARSDDLGYALFLWLNLGTDGPPAREQARRIVVFCDAYGIAEDTDIVETIANAISRNIQRLREQRRPADARWWQTQLHWVERNRVELTLG